jgi:alpha-1,3/alpha-1,6-mannosyltransferase
VISRLVAIKNLGLAIDAMAALRTRVSPEAFAPLRLVIAGGFDARMRDGVETYAGLTARAQALGLTERVEIVRSPDDAALRALLGRARALVYTPAFEHFGYVPSKPWPPAAR